MPSNAQRWFLENVALLSRKFGGNSIVADASCCEYILITRYQLPSNWMQKSSRLLIRFLDINTIFNVPPNNFYLDKGLRTLRGTVPNHYFESGGFNDLGKRGLARFSFHVEKGWFPKLPASQGTTLIDVLSLLNQGMYKAANEGQ